MREAATEETNQFLILISFSFFIFTQHDFEQSLHISIATGGQEHGTQLPISLSTANSSSTSSGRAKAESGAQGACSPSSRANCSLMKACAPHLLAAEELELVQKHSNRGMPSDGRCKRVICSQKCTWWLHENQARIRRGCGMRAVSLSHAVTVKRNLSSLICLSINSDFRRKFWPAPSRLIGSIKRILV